MIVRRMDSEHRVNDVAAPPAQRPQSWLGLATLMIAVALLATSLKPRAKQDGTQAPLDPAKLREPGRLSARLTVWSWNIAAKSLRSLVPTFQKTRCPGVDVNVEMSGTNLQTRFLLSLSAGAGAPDIMQLQCHEASRYTATGRLTDLTAVAAKYEKDFPAASWANCVRDGRVYAIPWDVGPCAVFYKPAIFTKYGVDPARIETWDDYIAAGRTIMQQSGGRTKMLALSPGQLQMMYEMLLQQVDGQVFDDDGRIAINSRKSEQVLNLIRRMIDAGICANVPMWGHDWMAGFGSETIASYPGAVWLGGTIKDTSGEYGASNDGWRVLELPAVERGGLRTSNLGGSVLVIPDQCLSKEAAWAFIEYALCTREGQVAQYAEFDLFPAYLPALNDPFFNEPDPFYGGQRIRGLFVNSVNGIPVLNRTPDWVEANSYANQAFTRWLAERSETRAMLDTVAAKLARRFGRDVVPKDAQ